MKTQYDLEIIRVELEIRAYLKFLKCVRRALHSIICKCFVCNIANQKIGSGTNTIHFIDLSDMYAHKFWFQGTLIHFLPKSDARVPWIGTEMSYLYYSQTELAFDQFTVLVSTSARYIHPFAGCHWLWCFHLRIWSLFQVVMKA